MAADALRDIGLLDESFFAYYEDLEWCLRASAKRPTTHLRADDKGISQRFALVPACRSRRGKAGELEVETKAPCRAVFKLPQ